MLMQIFFSCCHSTPHMALRFVHVKNLPRLSRQCGIDLVQPFRYILMYRTFLS